MKAIVHHQYGSRMSSLAVEEIEEPVAEGDDVLIRVHAAGVGYLDSVMIRGVPYIARVVGGLRRPKHGVRGTEVAGTVAEVGAKVADLRPGGEVFGWCGRAAAGGGGGFAEYARCPRNMVVLKPATIRAGCLPSHQGSRPCRLSGTGLRCSQARRS
jgi:NADPH:quinone reductase-like Zn-dependent oxidoreductase